MNLENPGESEAATQREQSIQTGLCDACQLFGATGWKRRFTMRIHRDDTIPIWDDSGHLLHIVPPKRTRGWYLPPGRMGEFTIRLRGLRESLSRIVSLLLFLEKYGSLGAKPQLGYGLFRLADRGLDGRIEPFKWAPIGDGPTESPNITEFMFFSYQFEPQKPGWWTSIPGLAGVATEIQPLVNKHQVVPVSPSLKNEWRYEQYAKRMGDDKNIFGSVQPTRIRSRVAVSWAFRSEDHWEIRGWARMPADMKAAEVLWRILCDRRTWERVVGVPGRLEVLPNRKEWQPWTVDELEGVLGGCIC